MSRFNEKRLAYGVENPLAKKGALGYFSNSYKVIRDRVDADAVVLFELKKADVSQPFPYQDERGNIYKLFYVVEEAPKYKPLSDEGLLKLLGRHVTHEPSGIVYKIARFNKGHLDDSEVLIVNLDSADCDWKTSKSLLNDGYILSGGSPVGEIQQ